MSGHAGAINRLGLCESCQTFVDIAADTAHDQANAMLQRLTAKGIPIEISARVVAAYLRAAIATEPVLGLYRAPGHPLRELVTT